MIIVTGATGLTGGSLVRHLSSRGIAVRALVRSLGKARELAALPGVEVIEGDMERPESLATPLRGVTRAVLISSSVPAMRDAQCNFIDAAKGAGVAHIIKVSGIMPELDSPFRFARMHGEIEKHLEASGVAFTHLRPGEFMHSYLRALPNIIAKQALFLPMEDAKIASLDIGDLVEVAAACLTTPGHEGKIYHLTGPQALTMTEAAEILSAVTGKAIRYVNVPPEVFKKNQLAAGFPPYLADALFELFAERRKGKESKVWNTSEEVFKLRPTSFEDFARRHAAVFRGEPSA